MMAGLVCNPEDLQEQAEIDGSGYWRRRCSRSPSPLMLPLIAVAALFGVNRDVHGHDVVYVLTRRTDELDAVLSSWLSSSAVSKVGCRARGGGALFLFPLLLVARFSFFGRCAEGVCDMAAVDAVGTDKVIETLRRRAIRRHRLARVGLYLAAIAAALICAGPFLWSLITRVQTEPDLYHEPTTPFLYNLPSTRKHVMYLFQETAFLTFVWNTLWVGLLVVAITLVLSLPAAYALARLGRPWSGPMAIAIFFVYLVPPTLLFLSLSRLVVAVHLQDNTWSLVLVYPTITIPVSVWLLVGFLKAFRDIEEQAMWMDIAGWGRVRTSWCHSSFRGSCSHRLHIHADRKRVSSSPRFVALPPRR